MRCRLLFDEQSHISICLVNKASSSTWFGHFLKIANVGKKIERKYVENYLYKLPKVKLLIQLILIICSEDLIFIRKKKNWRNYGIQKRMSQY